MLIQTRLGDGDPLITHVGDSRRLDVVSGAALHGHLGDTDLDAVVATLAIAIRVPMAVINVVTSNRQTYVSEIGLGVAFTTVEDRLSFCAQVVETGRALAIADSASHRTYAENPLVLSGHVGAYAGEPLVDSGYVIGSVAIFDETPRDFSEDDLAILRHQTRLASAVLALRRAARADSLTGLPNRELLMDRLSHALAQSERQGRRVGVFFVDVDDFKSVNDHYGHAAGDRYLIELAQRIGRVIRPGDTLGRLGGDEFVLVSEDLNSDDQVRALAERILATLQAPNVDLPEVPFQVSIGVALSTDSLTSAARLLARADTAMYRAKQSPGSCWELSDWEEVQSDISS